MRFVSNISAGYRVFAVSGVNTTSFAIDFTAADAAGLLGFAVEREDPAEHERYYMRGEKVFAHVVPHPDAKTVASTFDQPVQSFVWDDFTCKPDRQYHYWFHPLKGTPKNLDRGTPPVAITIRTEPLFTPGEHDVFFNRGVASSQAYAREFDNQKPDDITDPHEQQRAFDWLARDLETALLKFIDATLAGETLLGCFYEFSYAPVLERLKAALDRGVRVRLIVDGKINEYTDKEGKFHPSAPRVENQKAVHEAGLDAGIALWREHNPDDIAHNKFMVRVRADGQAHEVWTGSTNITESGIFGQTNVGHWLRNADVATLYAGYWSAMLPDPGATPGDDQTTSRAAKARWRETVAALLPTPARWPDIAPGVTPVFSPRAGTGVLDMYVAALDEAHDLACITLAFGIGSDFKTRLLTHTAANAITFLLLEKQDLPNKRSKTPFVRLGASNNVYAAWGAFLSDPIYQWTAETNAKQMGITTFVNYIHSKLLLHDPLGADPIVVTGSANFSADSTNNNDENMLLIRGNQRVADIYFTEFNRLFFHYYFRSVLEEIQHRHPASGNGAADNSASLFLDETDGWLQKYAPGSLRAKRVEMFTRMANTATL